MLKQSDFFHGVLLSKLLDHDELNVKKHPYFSAYIINNKAYYIKYSSNRISPWSFSFSETHVTEIVDLSNQFEEVFIALICNKDGICCLNLREFKTVIAIENMNFPKWIKTIRQKREKYSVAGSDGKLIYKIGDNCLHASIEKTGNMK
jgi:hypothetical protein